MPVKEIIQRGKDAGFSPSQLRRARKAAGVAEPPDKLGFAGGWGWRLKDDGSTPSKMTKVTLPCNTVIFDRNQTVTPFASTTSSKITGLSPSASPSDDEWEVERGA
jgi:hypothetical protein